MRKKIKEWIKRYLLADILSTALSLFTAWLIMELTEDRVMAAFVGSAVASISFYGIIAYNDFRKSLKKHKNSKKKIRVQVIFYRFQKPDS
ncbi:MAG: hypothetical protein H8D45_31415 [Bacteroidetes bacterium]|nr:hypothetical protein [Bacteroidota bacterium]